MEENGHILKIDFDTDRVASRIVDGNGSEISAATVDYPRWSKKLYINEKEQTYRQHPLDFAEGLELSVKKALSLLPDSERETIAQIAVAAVASTPVAVDEKGTPLSLTPGFQDNRNAMFVLWNERIATAEAAEINRLIAKSGIVEYAEYECDSTDFWPKILHIIRNDIAVFRVAFSWVELCDWIPGLLTGNVNPKTIRRNRETAVQKALWRESLGGLPSDAFLTALDPMLAGLRQRLYTVTYESGENLGKISLLWARKLGLSPYVTVKTSEMGKA